MGRGFVSPRTTRLSEVRYRCSILFIITKAGHPAGGRGGAVGVKSPTSSLGSLIIGSISFEGGDTSCAHINPILSFFGGPSMDCCNNSNPGCCSGVITYGSSLNTICISNASFTTP